MSEVIEFAFHLLLQVDQPILDYGMPPFIWNAELWNETAWPESIVIWEGRVDNLGLQINV